MHIHHTVKEHMYSSLNVESVNTAAVDTPVHAYVHAFKGIRWWHYRSREQTHDQISFCRIWGCFSEVVLPMQLLEVQIRSQIMLISLIQTFSFHPLQEVLIL